MYVFSRRIIYLQTGGQFHNDDVVTLLEWSEMDTLIDLSIPFQHSQNGFIIQNRRHDMIGPMRLSYF